MHKLVKEGLTFDDVLLLPGESDVVPADVDIRTKLTEYLVLNAPLVSAGMDTVTESQMAIALARQGGVGFIHGNMSAEAQAAEVDKVKRSENGVITEPFFLSPNHYVYEADDLMARYRISGVPITENGKLVGIITNRDIRFETDHHKKVYEVMTQDNLVTAPEGTTLEQAQTILTKRKIEKLPLVDARGNLKGLITIKDIEKAIKYPNSAKDDQGRLIVGASLSLSDDVFERIGMLIQAKVDVISLEFPHTHLKSVAECIRKIKAAHPKLQIMVGNVATAEATESLIKVGADAIKVGIGSGAVSTTRVITGVGVPQLTAIYDCSEAAKAYGIPIIADGGIKYSGDITKAIAAGANACMIGSLFAGSKESPGETELYHGRKYKVYRWMGATGTTGTGVEIAPEGVEGRVSYRGSVADTLFQLIGGLRLGMAYCGSKTICELQESGKFIKMSSYGLKESHPHDIQITKESPNYSIEY